MRQFDRPAGSGIRSSLNERSAANRADGWNLPGCCDLRPPHPAGGRRCNPASPPRARWLRGVACTSFVGLVLTIAACATNRKETPPIASNAQQIGFVYVSAYPEVPWSKIRNALSPHRNWTISEAQKVATSTTAAQTNLVSSVLAAALEFNLPTLSSSKSSATTLQSGKTSTTRSTKSSETSGAVPGTTPTLPSAPALPSAPSLGSNAPSLSSVDGSDLLITSTALFQEAAIIDNQISKEYLPLGYSAHLLTFQINLQPLRPDWSYDAFVDITLLPEPIVSSSSEASGTGGKMKLPPVIVLPLIISDAIETVSVQQSFQQIRQALLQLSGSLGTTGASAGLNAGRNQNRSVAGYDKNSLVTMGRISDSTVRVRLGAEYSGYPYPTLVPRTYNVSLLVLTRGTFGSAHPEVRNLAAVTHTFFVPYDRTPNSSRTEYHLTRFGYVQGSTSRFRCALAKRVAWERKIYHYPKVHGSCGDGTFVDHLLNGLRETDRGDYRTLMTSLGMELPLHSAAQERLYRFVASLSEIQDTSDYSRFDIPLEHVVMRLPDTDQFALVQDDKKSDTETVTLLGGQGIDTDNIDVWGLFSLPKGPQLKLAPSSVSYLADTTPTQLRISFPLPDGMRVLKRTGAQKGRYITASAASLSEVVISKDDTEHDECACAYPTIYKDFAELPAAHSGATCAATKKPIAVGSNVIMSSKDFSGRIQIKVGDLPGIIKACKPAKGGSGKGALKPPFKLVVSGANVPAQTGPCITGSLPSMLLRSSGKCSALLNLDNLSTDVPVALAVTDSHGTPVGTAIQLRVVGSSRSH